MGLKILIKTISYKIKPQKYICVQNTFFKKRVDPQSSCAVRKQKKYDSVFD